MTRVGRAAVEVEAGGSEVRVVVAGEIDLANAADLQELLFSVITNTTTSVQVDLSDVAYVDSAGLGVLFRLADRLRIGQTELLVTAPARSPARLAIEVSGMAQLCGLADDR